MDKTLTTSRRIVFTHALLFVAGFSLVFIIGWGGSVTLLGNFFGLYKDIIARIGGVIVIIFGLATLDILRIPWFYADTRAQITNKKSTYASSGMMGIFFGAGWSPCIGATLGAILTLGLSQNTVWQAMWLSSGYSLGLGLPFLALALGLEKSTGWVNRMKHYQRGFKIASGVFIISVGLLLATDSLSLISIWAFRNGYYIESFAVYAAVPTYFTAVIAGLLSFLSPCVLPLVPAYLGYLSGHAVQKGDAV